MTPKQRRFVDEYLVDLVATQAALRAGYSPRSAYSQGERLLKKAEVAEAIRVAEEERKERTKVTQDMVIKELARIGFFDHRRLYDANGGLKQPHEMDDDSAAVVSGVESMEEYQGAGSARVLTGHVRKVRLWDKVAALTKLGQHLGMFVEQVDVRGKVSIAQVDLKALSDDQLAGIEETLSAAVRDRSDRTADSDPAGAGE
jgi:phage terminase small subunit